MLTRVKCSLGHEWEPAGPAPLVCPTCGNAALALPPDSSESTVDDEQTLDLPASTQPPTPAPASPVAVGIVSTTIAALNASHTPPPSPPNTSRDDATETLDYTPGHTPPPSHHSTPPGTRPPLNQQSSAGRSTGGAPRSLAGQSNGLPKSTPPTGMPFTIVRQHARGGLGVVSLARDDQIRREVALKQILPQHVDNPVLKRRFVYEGQITGQLEHPSIVPVYTMGADDAQNPFYVMRFVKGRTLDEIIKEHHASPNPIVFRELLRRFIAVCQAVAYAHSRGVIHRDLKPANVMLGDYGETLVLDWGLAKDIKQGGVDPALWTNPPTPAPSPAPHSSGISQAARTSPQTTTTPQSELTMEGQIIGTPAYMAPEQAEGRTELHGPVTDIYALGGILYKILCGHSPTAPTASTETPGHSRKLTYVPSPAPSTVNNDTDPLLEQICLRAMARDPAARYARALELAQDVQRWLDEHPLTLRPRTALARLHNSMRNHSTLVLSALLLLTTLTATLATLLILRRH